MRPSDAKVGAEGGGAVGVDEVCEGGDVVEAMERFKGFFLRMEPRPRMAVRGFGRRARCAALEMRPSDSKVRAVRPPKQLCESPA